MTKIQELALQSYMLKRQTTRTTSEESSNAGDTSGLYADHAHYTVLLPQGVLERYLLGKSLLEHLRIQNVPIPPETDVDNLELGNHLKFLLYFEMNNNIENGSVNSGKTPNHDLVCYDI